MRVLLYSHPDEPDVRWYSPLNRTFDKSADDRVPVLVTPGEEEARKQHCPACGERNTIRFLGLAEASLASVSINTLFGSPNVDADERKLLAFTDSVQDASHRASFFGGRTHRINLRSLMARIAKREQDVSLVALGELLLTEASTQRDRFGLVPPDLVSDPVIRTAWTDDPADGAVEMLAARLGFEVDLEFGLRARVGRTLELSRVAVASVHLEDEHDIAALLLEDIERLTGSRPDPDAVVVYLRGLLERLRLRGGLVHPLLEPFVAEGGRQWQIWGGRPRGLPAFTPDQSRPSFFTTAPRGDLDSLTAVGPNPTWVVDWAVRNLGLEPAHARDLNSTALRLLAKETDVVVALKSAGSTAYGLDRTVCAGCRHRRFRDSASRRGSLPDMWAPARGASGRC